MELFLHYSFFLPLVPQVLLVGLPIENHSAISHLQTLIYTPQQGKGRLSGQFVIRDVGFRSQALTTILESELQVDVSDMAVNQ